VKKVVIVDEYSYTKVYRYATIKYAVGKSGPTPQFLRNKKMDERSKQHIREHLQSKDVQERVQRYIEKGRAEATVTIGRAAELFNLSENRLRDWEEYGLLNPLRPTGPKGRRLYTPSELDKLAIIRELLDAGYAPSDIPPDIDGIWQVIYAQDRQSIVLERRSDYEISSEQADGLSINRRFDLAYDVVFWRYYASRALRLSLALICENVPNATGCLVLPLEQTPPATDMLHVEDIIKGGESLVGWLGRDYASATMLVSRPMFDYVTDYRLLPLTVMTEDRVEQPPVDSTYILLDRRSKRLSLSAPIVATIKRLLAPLYEDRGRTRECFSRGMRDVLELSSDLAVNDADEDAVLNGLAEMVVQLGGHVDDDQPRWSYCCILLPNYPSTILSLQQRSLVVRAQSEYAPYKVGVTTFPSYGYTIDRCIAAYQSGHVIYQPVIPLDEEGISSRHTEPQIRSAIAVPVAGAAGTIVAVLYVASAGEQAFTEDDQRVLRMIGCMVEELVETYAVRVRATARLGELISAPAIVDPLFQDFLSENEFAEDVEQILRVIHLHSEYGQAENLQKDVVSIIAIDIDNQSSLANRYGDAMARDVSRAVGLRIQGQLRAFKDEAECRLYRVNADRFYMLLNGMPLEQAKVKAELLRKVLSGSYQIDPLRAPAGQPTLPENMITFSNITVRLGVSSYFYWKLQEIMRRYSIENAAVKARILLEHFLDEVLDIGKREGGNVVVSWDPQIRGFVRFSPTS
jgi:GGDEF domain-containing protein/GAF domain-containing protein